MAEENTSTAEGGDDKTALANADDKTALAADDKAAADDKTALAADDKTALTKKEGEEQQEEREGAPEGDYADFTVPEGVVLEPEGLKKFQDLAKKFDLSQAHAQELVDFQIEIQEALKTEQATAWKDLKDEWLASSKADEGIGGQKFDASVEAGKRALAEFGTPQLTELLETFGLGNHPEIIRFVSRVGEAIGEDKIVSGRSGGQSKSLAERLYPSHQAQ